MQATKLRHLLKAGLMLTCLFAHSAIAVTPEGRQQALLNNFSGSNEIPIIVQVVGSAVTQDNFDSAARDGRSVSAQKLTLIAEMGLQAAQVKYLGSTDLVAMRVGRTELSNLLLRSDISVFEDKLHRPLLSESVPRVYPSQNSSPYHGDNNWAVAVLDSGIDKSHPFLTGKVVSEACYSTNDAMQSVSSLCPGGVSASTAVNSGSDCSIAGCGHGTQVAGIIAGNGASFDGVARDAQLISIQVYSQINDSDFCFPELICLGAFTSDLIAGLQRVYDLRNSIDIAAVNISLGSTEVFSGTCNEQPENAIINLLTQANIAVVAASGNTGNTSQMTSPACISNAIAVAATLDTSDVPWSNNNTSVALDLFAPGVGIVTSDAGGGFVSTAGTSGAAAHVAGAWAVLRHKSPSMSVAAITTLLKNSGPLVTQNSLTRRRINVTSVLSALTPPDPPPPPGPPSANSFLPAVIMLLLDSA